MKLFINALVFIKKIVPGGVQKSYGIEVAGLAGLPEGVIRRAKKILKEIESQGHVQEKPVRAPDPLDQITLGGMAGSDIIEELKTIDPNVLTPFEAMGRLYELVKKAKEC